MKTKIVTVIALALIVFINFSIWSYVNNPLQLQPWTKITMGVTFDPMRKQDTQTSNIFPSEADIDHDLSLLENKVHAVRTYSVLKGLDKIPELAAKHNLYTTVGAWIDGNLEKNRQEIETLINVSRQNNPNIVRVMVGNEVLLRAKIPPEQLIEYIREVKKNTWRPVSTSETWDVWLKHPELVAEVDFIAVHILPYWEGIAVEDAVDYVFDRYHAVQKAYPNKPIVITEVGWPSDGQPFKHATASISNQAKFLREFLNRADAERATYYIVEAFDQPWKMSLEGSAGAYWGIFNADRQPKYPMDADVITIPNWNHWATAAAIFSVVLMAFFLLTRSSMKLPGLLFFGLIANLAASTIFWTVSISAQQFQTIINIVLLLTSSLVIWYTCHYYANPRSLQGGISDAPVTQAQEDCLGRLELVKTLADLIRNRDTVPPLAIAITAPWGSGKSSVLGLLQHELQGEVFAVQLNAWHYRDDGQLLAALMEHVREQALPPMLSLDNLLFRLRLLWLRCFAGFGFRGLTALFAGLTATAFFAKQQQWQVLDDWLKRELPALIPAWLKTSIAEPWFKPVFALLAALLVYRLLKSWLAAFSAFSPELVAVASRLGKSAKEAMQVADWSKDAGLRFRFARDFETLAKALGKGRLLLLIDDLDRCEPKQIESVMTTLNFLFSTPAPCYAVLAMDWEYVTDALGVAFKDLAVARADTDTKGKNFAEHYLEKIIQIRIHLPAVDGSQVALIDHSRRTDEEVVDWWGKLAGYWPWLNAMDRVFYPLTPTLSLRERGLDSAGGLRWARFAAAVLQSPLRLLVSVVWRGLEAGLWTCWQAVKRFNSKMLGPVSDGLLILLLATALAFVAVQLGVVAQDFASQPSKPDAVESNASVGESVKNVMPEPEKKPVEVSEPKAAAAPVVFVDEQRYPTHYGLWTAAGCLSLMLLVMIWRLSLRVQDTQTFIEVMTEWQLWLAEHHDTPRDWKRLLNRARLFAMRVRVYRQKPWYAEFDEKWQAWRFRRQPLPVPAQRDELDERLAMHLLMLDVYMKGELATIVWQFFKNKKDNDSFNRLIEALMKRSNDFPELKILMNHLERSYNEANDERSAEQEKAGAQLRLWFSLYAGLNTLRL